jgi:hypothetical protein
MNMQTTESRQDSSPLEPQEPPISTPPAPPPSSVVEPTGRNRVAAGVALIVLGAFALLGQLIQGSFWGTLFLPGLGIFFVIWGFIASKPGLLIPGGILLGIGIGTALIQGPFSHFSSDGQGGVIMLSLGGGFLLVTLFTALLRRVHWWALIPAAILGVIGLGLVGKSAGWDIMRYLSTAWPIALIVVGAFLIVGSDQ